MAKNTDTRVNLRVYTQDATSGDTLYHVIHIGFFPTTILPRMIPRLNARGIAFHTEFPGQLGIVDVMTCEMGPNNNPEVVSASEYYEPRRGMGAKSLASTTA